MSEEIQEMQRQIVNAVQQELTRFSTDVASNMAQLREELANGASARTQLEQQVHALAVGLERSQSVNVTFQNELQQLLEVRLDEFATATNRRHEEINTRLGRVVDEANNGIVAAVESAAHPILKQIEHRQDKVESDLGSLDSTIRTFDDQASKMVGHINAVTSAVDTRLGKITNEVTATFDERIAELILRVDEVSATAARQQAEVSNIVGTRVDASEERINERMLTLESRITDEIGQRVADIDAHVGRIGAGLDDAVITLNDRIAKADGRFTEMEAEFVKVREELADVDSEAIDEMKDKVSSALGQAELVRIEMERFQVTITESLDHTAVRLTEIETTVQDQSMDVETAVQLERLEEVERAVLMLDPDIIAERRQSERRQSDRHETDRHETDRHETDRHETDHQESSDLTVAMAGAIATDSLPPAPSMPATAAPASTPVTASIPSATFTMASIAPLAPPSADPAAAGQSAPSLQPPVAH